MADYLLEYNINLGASFMPPARDVTEIFAADLTKIDFGYLCGFYDSGIGSALVVLLIAFTFRPGLVDGAIVFFGLRRGFARIRRVFVGDLFHEYGQHHL